MRRARPKTFAATDDPYQIPQHFDHELAQHQRILDQQPPDRAQEVEGARAALQRAEVDLAEACRVAERCAVDAANANAGLRRIPRRPGPPGRRRSSPR